MDVFQISTLIRSLTVTWDLVALDRACLACALTAPNEVFTAAWNHEKASNKGMFCGVDIQETASPDRNLLAMEGMGKIREKVQSLVDKVRRPLNAALTAANFVKMEQHINYQEKMEALLGLIYDTAYIHWCNTDNDAGDHLPKYIGCTKFEIANRSARIAKALIVAEN